jgi:hypothetical protein
MKKGPSESTEVFEPLEIVILEPEGDKKFMVGFGNTLQTGRYSMEQMNAYAYAIEDVLEGAGLRVFHQVGAGETDGTQMWEIWSSGVDRKSLEGLIPTIHQEAEKYNAELLSPID